jgi:HPt (histidine-containing phosphotransfer) domain-containing protein
MNTQVKQLLEQIEGLSVQTGLDRVFGQWDVYRKSLKLTIKEIEKCDNNLNKFLAEGDMRNFSIEAHSMKGLLSNIGADDISVLALELENASNRADSAFCVSALQPFLKALGEFAGRLMEAFAQEDQNNGPIEIPADLPIIFDKLKTAFDEANYLAMDKEIENLDALMPGGALKEEIEKIKDAVMMMDYDCALEVMRDLLKKQKGGF